MDMMDDQGPMTFDRFMALSPQQRHDLLIQGDVTQYGYAPEYGYAANLRNIVPDANHANAPLSVDQYRSILGGSGIDPGMAQGIWGNLGGILDDQYRASQDTKKDKLAQMGAVVTAAFAGGAGIGGAMGAGAAGAGAGTGEGIAAGGAGLEAGSSPFLSGLDAGAVANADYAGLVGGGMDAAAGGATATGSAIGADGLDLSGLAGNDIPGYGSVTPGMTLDASPLGFQASTYWDALKQYGASGLNALKGWLSGNGGGTGVPGGGAGGGGLLDAGARAAPGIAALAYANKQPGLDVGPLKGILSTLGGNQDAVIRAATDPFQQNIAAGYGDILRSQGLRGIRGSSFGDTDIANYLSTTGRSLANAGANAAEGSLTLQGNLASNIAQLQNQAQQIKNSLYGRAFDVLGRGINPTGYGMRATA